MLPETVGTNITAVRGGEDDDKKTNAEDEQQDPFDCFGSDSDDNEQEQATPITTPAMKRSHHLVHKSNIRTRTPTGVCVPLVSPNYEVFDSVSAGKGLKALKDFVCGEEILRERAAMRIPNQQEAASLEEAEELHEAAVNTGFQNLDPSTKQAFLELSNCCDDNAGISPPVGIYQTNSYRLGESEPYGGLFLTIARLNHSCRPSCHHVWRRDLKEMLVFATRDISAGEELHTTYGPSQYLDTVGRQSYLLERFSFTCGCEMCLENNHDGGDDRMLKLDALQEDVSLLAASGKPEAAIEAIEQCLELLREQRIDTGALVKPLLHYGYQVAMGRIGDMAMAQSYLSKELIAVEHSEGAGSPKAMDIQRILDGIVLDTDSTLKNTPKNEQT